MPEETDMYISRAVARMLVRGGDSDCAWRREFERMKTARDQEEAAGIEYGPAEQEFHQMRALTRGIVEVMDGRGLPSYQHIARIAAPRLPCYYCEDQSAESDRLCSACRQFIRAVIDGEIPEMEFAEQGRYKRTISRWMRGEHLVRDADGKIVGLKDPEAS